MRTCALKAALAPALTLAFALCATSAHAKTYSIRAGAEASAQLAAALAAAQPRDRIQFGKGRFELTAPIALSVSQLTLRGDGANNTILSFTGKGAPGACVQMSGAQLSLTAFAVENCNGDAIVAANANQVTLSNLSVSWTGVRAASASGISAVGSKNVFVDSVVARGASLAGVRIAGSSNVIVRDSIVSQSTIGFAIENTVAADLSRNTATHNAVGVAVYDLPGAAQAGGAIRLFDKNQIIANDGANTAPADSFAGTLPAGTGIVITSSRDVHVLENQISDNGSVNVLLAGFRGAKPDPKFNALPRNVAIRRNEFGRAGFSPQGDLKALADLGVKLPDILWDGADTYFAGGVPRQEPVLLAIERNRGVAAGNTASFTSLGLVTAGSDFADMQPTNTFPPITNVAEPAEVKLPRGM